MGRNYPNPIAGQQHCFWLDPEWAEIVGAASEAGFIICGSWVHKYNVIIFKCIRGRRYNQHKNKVAMIKWRSKIEVK